AKEVPKHSIALGPGQTPVALNVNGKDYRVALEPRTTLADALRYQLNLTGTKIVCDRGACSACTVWLDKTPVNSCMTLAIDVGKRRVTTIEGLAAGDNLHPVQTAFIKHDALQCGFCTPGMIMSCAALLERNPHPDLNDVKLATSGNLCRCGTYPKVFDATLEAAEMQKSTRFFRQQAGRLERQARHGPSRRSTELKTGRSEANRGPACRNSSGATPHGPERNSRRRA